MIPEPGISLALAQARGSQISDVKYDVRFDLPAERLAPINAEIIIRFSLTHVDGPVVLDFAPNSMGRIVSCLVNSGVEDLKAIDGHLLLPPHRLGPGANTVRFEFVAGDASLNRREDHLYSIFVPARAHEVFPCFDQPDLKARWTLTLVVPLEWNAVANAEAASRRNVASPEGGTRSIIEFSQTEPLPTYLFAFAAGRFMEDVASRDGRRIRIYHCGVDSELFSRNRGAILDGHAEALRWLESYTNTPYPFSKFDIVLLPAFQFGGMEHPGAIFYNASAILLDQSATRQQMLARADVIAHETSHMWFGDLWTMRWFNDVWLKEALANYMASKIVNPRFPDLDHDLRFLHTNYAAAYDVDRTEGTHAIRQPLANLNEAGSLYGAIIYLKSPIVIRQLAMLIGEQALRDGLCEFLARYRFGNASWEDLLDLLASHTALDLHAWSRAWIDGAGRPIVRAELNTGGGLAHLNLHSLNAAAADQAEGAPRQKWPQRLEVGLGYGKWVEHISMSLDGRADVSTIVGYPPPAWVLPNGRGIGYGEFRLDSGSLTWLLASLPDIPDALTRASAWLTLWDAMLLRDIEPEALLALAVRAVPLETSELNLQRILLYIERLFWVFLTPAQREKNAKWLGAILRATVGSAPNISQKAALFGSLRAVATTDAMVEWMRALWSGDARIDGLPLSEGDQVMLVKELAVRAPDGDSLVQQQMGRMRNRDGRDGLAFIAPALSPEAGLRGRFFDTISDPANRRREPWVVDGMRWLHHPLRADSSVKYIEPGLMLLSEVKRTSDIFLPKRWVEAMLSGHRSVAAATSVRRFLDSRPPDYPPALNRMVLASADYLFRATASGKTAAA